MFKVLTLPSQFGEHFPDVHSWYAMAIRRYLVRDFHALYFPRLKILHRAPRGRSQTVLRGPSRRSVPYRKCKAAARLGVFLRGL
jgi:hypothetical protein